MQVTVPKASAPQMLIAVVRPGVSHDTLKAWTYDFGRESVMPEPGLKQDATDDNVMKWWFYSDSTPAQREHARQDIARSGLFCGIRWTKASRSPNG